MYILSVMELTPLQVYERDASARQVEVGQLRKTGEAHRKRVKLLEQEVASQRIIAKVSSGPNVCFFLTVSSLVFVRCASSQPNRWEERLGQPAHQCQDLLRAKRRI